MNGVPHLTDEERAFLHKWRWRVGLCYSAILLALLLWAAVTPDPRAGARSAGSAEQNFSSTSISYDHPQAP
jgi:hypothetical protein